jgi:hypothetical protein
VDFSFPLAYQSNKIIRMLEALRRVSAGYHNLDPFIRIGLFSDLLEVAGCVSLFLALVVETRAQCVRPGPAGIWELARLPPDTHQQQSRCPEALATTFVPRLSRHCVLLRKTSMNLKKPLIPSSGLLRDIRLQSASPGSPRPSSPGIVFCRMWL